MLDTAGIGAACLQRRGLELRVKGLDAYVAVSCGIEAPEAMMTMGILGIWQGSCWWQQSSIRPSATI